LCNQAPPSSNRNTLTPRYEEEMADTPQESGAGRASTPPGVPGQPVTLTLDVPTLHRIIADAIAAQNAPNPPQLNTSPQASTPVSAPAVFTPVSHAAPDIPIAYDLQQIGKRHVLPPLETFDGNKALYDQWRQKLSNKLRQDGSKIGDEEACRSYAFSVLIGDASDTITQWIANMTISGKPIGLNEMLAELDRNYTDNLRVQRARVEFEKLQMKPGSDYLTYRKRYETLATQSRAIMDYAPHVLARRFAQSLPQYLITPAVSILSQSPPQNLKSAMDVFDGINMTLQTLKYNQSSSQGSKDSSQQQPGAVQVAQTIHASNDLRLLPSGVGTFQGNSDGDPMDWTRTNQAGNRYSWETDPRPEGPFVQKQEIDARRNVRACFTCGGQHRSRQCALKPNRRNWTQARTQARVVNAEAVTQVHHAASSALTEPREQLKDLP
jgi:hypothetical protein